MNTSKQLADPDHLKVFADAGAAEAWFAANDPEGVAVRGNRASSLNRRALLLRAVLDVLDVFFSQIQQPPGGHGIGDLTGQPPALINLLDECRM